jgi:hypothetical protein
LQWLKGREIIRKALKDLEKIVLQGCDLYPSNKRLKIKRIKRNYCKGHPFNRRKQYRY